MKTPRTLVAESYPVIAHDLLRPLVDMLSLSREACGGDVDNFLILLVVGIRATEHEAFAGYRQDELLSGQVPVFPSLRTNIRSISESLGIPKETVRRKVTELVQAGWIVRQRNDLYFTALAYQRLAHVRDAIERLAVRNFEIVRDLLKSQAAR